MGEEEGKEGREEEEGENVIRMLGLLFLLAILNGCSWDGYEVIEKSVTELPAEITIGSHSQINYVLLHDGRKFYAKCDFKWHEKEDPHTTCAFSVLKTYACVQGRDGWRGDSWDLKCKDFDGNNVYLEVSKVEAVK